MNQLRAKSHAICVMCLLVLTVASPARAAAPASAPASMPASMPTTAPADWGKAVSGLRCAAAIDEPLVVGGEVKLHILLQNTGSAPVKLPSAQANAEGQPFAWVFLAKAGEGGKKAGYFTEKIPFVKAAKDWPDELAPGQTALVHAGDIGPLVALPYKAGKLDKGYPADAEMTQRDQAVVIILQTGKVSIRVMLFLPRSKAEGDVLLTSNTLELQVAPPRLDKLSEKDRKAFLADLDAKFAEDAFAGRSAHELAVKLGADALPTVIAAAKDTKRHAYGRLWAATAVADIPDERAAAALLELLDDKDGGVRCIVAYHGVKQHSDKLDKAIIAKAAADKEASFTAYALLGFMVFGNNVPEDLLKLGLESDDAKVRSAAVSALAGMASDANVSRLKAMLNDKDERVQSTAKKVLEAMGKK